MVGIIVLLLMNLAAACSPGHNGDNVIGFVRAGQLWTIDPDGANAFAIASEGTAVVGYSWSPNHRIVVFRQLDTTFARSNAAKNLRGLPVTGQIADGPSTLNTVGVDGGTAISIALSSPDVRYNTPFWIENGARLLYRQESIGEPTSQEGVTWWVSQNDQPAGIAAKSLPPLFSIPSVDTNSGMVAGTSQEGIVTTTLTGSNKQNRVSGLLEGHPLAASLERVLWQPGKEALLYAVALQDGKVELRLEQKSGEVITLVSCACTQFAWSPNGQMILYKVGKSFTIFSLQDKSSYSVQAEEDSVPSWSPDSRFLVLDGSRTLVMVRPIKRESEVLLQAGTGTQVENGENGVILPAKNALLQPVANSIWASDGRHFLVTTGLRLDWQGKKLAQGEGLYTVGIGSEGRVEGLPVLVTGEKGVAQAGWTYQDPESSFLY